MKIVTSVSRQLRYSSTPSAIDGRQDRAGQLHEAGADEVPDAFRVAHDPRDEDAALGRVEVADRQAHHVRLDFFAHLGDGALRRDAEHLRVGERRRGIDHAWPRRPPCASVGSRSHWPLPITSSIEVVGRRRQDEAGEPVDQHQAESEAPAACGGSR